MSPRTIDRSIVPYRTIDRSIVPLVHLLMVVIISYLKLTKLVNFKCTVLLLCVMFNILMHLYKNMGQGASLNIIAKVFSWYNKTNNNWSLG